MDKRIFVAKVQIEHNGKPVKVGGKFILDLDDEEDGKSFDQLDAVEAIEDLGEATDEMIAELEAEANPRKAARRAKAKPAPDA